MEDGGCRVTVGLPPGPKRRRPGPTGSDEVVGRAAQTLVSTLTHFGFGQSCRWPRRSRVTTCRAQPRQPFPVAAHSRRVTRRPLRRGFSRRSRACRDPARRLPERSLVTSAGRAGVLVRVRVCRRDGHRAGAAGRAVRSGTSRRNPRDRVPAELTRSHDRLQHTAFVLRDPAATVRAGPRMTTLNGRSSPPNRPR